MWIVQHENHHSVCIFSLCFLSYIACFFHVFCNYSNSAPLHSSIINMCFSKTKLPRDVGALQTEWGQLTRSVKLRPILFQHHTSVHTWFPSRIKHSPANDSLEVSSIYLGNVSSVWPAVSLRMGPGVTGKPVDAVSYPNKQKQVGRCVGGGGGKQ